MEAMSGRWRGLIKGGFYERNDLCPQFVISGTKRCLLDGGTD
jgi:hypothetical protein